MHHAVSRLFPRGQTPKTQRPNLEALKLRATSKVRLAPQTADAPASLGPQRPCDLPILRRGLDGLSVHAVRHVAAVADRAPPRALGPNLDGVHQPVQLVMAMRVDREKIASLPALEDGRELV